MTVAELVSEFVVGYAAGTIEVVEVPDEHRSEIAVEYCDTCHPKGKFRGE